MELTDYLKVVRRRWVWIVITTLICAVAALCLTLIQTKEYASTARLFVSTPALSDPTALYSGGQFSQQQVQSYASLVSSHELAQQVISDVHLSLTPQELSNKVSATVAPNTVNLNLTATDPNPHLAQAIAQSYAEHLTNMIRQLETPPGRSRAPVKATIFDNASFSSSPVSPKPVRNVALGVVVGLLIGFGLALLRQKSDMRITSAEDLAEFSGAPVLGGILHDPDVDGTPLVSDAQSHSPRAEAFRVLRTNLQFVDVDTPQKVFVVTSAVPEEGKTLTAANIAVSLAQAGIAVLLLEGDLRRPKAHHRLQLDGAVGLTNLLIGQTKLEDALQTHESTGLDFLASGPIPPNPAELLQSNAMADLLKEVRSAYDVVIVDAPPLLPVTDAAVLAAGADGALLVVRYRRVTRDQIRHSIERLTQVDAPFVGFVLNDVPVKGRRHGYGYGYGYGYAPKPDT